MSTFVKKVASVVLSSAVVLTAVGSTAGVSADYTNVEAANILSSNGVIVDQSTNPAAYGLGNTLLKQEGVKVMSKLSGRAIPASCDSSSFADVATSDWVCKYTEDSLAAGFIAANTNFGPEGLLTKGQALKMVMQGRNIEKTAGMSPWQAGYVDAAVEAGIANYFADYSTPVDRGTFFVWAAEAIAPSEDAAMIEVDENDLLSGLLDGLGDVVETPAADEAPAVAPVETPVVSSDDMLTVSLNPETPSNGLAQADTARIPLLVFDVKAGSQDVTLNEATFEFVGLGDYNLLEDVSIYNAIGEKVSKTKSFSEITREISFDRDIVVEAGQTMTLTVAGKLATDGDDNATYGIKLVDLQASSDVEGEDLVGALLVSAVFSNVPSLEITDDTATGDVVIGENQKLAGFDIEERNDNGDVVINTITIHLDGSVDEDDVTDLALSIEGTEVASNLMVNGDDEIVALVNYTLASDDKVSVELTGTVVGSVGDSIKFVFEGADDIYATAANTGMPVAISNADITTEEISDLNNIEGAEINIAFDTSDVDEANPDSEDVLIGTLRMTATSDDYEITSLEVKVTGTTVDAIDDLELGGSSYDSVEGNVYTFEDIVLSAGEELSLELTMDLNEETEPATLNGETLIFDVTVVEIEDDTNDVTYVDGDASFPTSDILSTTALSTQSIDIESAGITFTAVQVNERELVLGNGIETVIYKGKISVSDSETVTIQDFNLVASANNSLSGENLDDVIDNATLNIGGQTFGADVEADSVDFTNINAVIAAGADNIEVLVTAVLKDNDSITGAGNILALEVDTTTMELEDSNGDDLVAANITTTNINTSSKLAETSLLDRGTFLVKVVTNGELEDDIEETVLAGSSAVALAEVEIQAEYEAIDVDALTFTVAGDFSDSLLNVHLIAADGTVIASDAVVNLNGGNTEILFEDFTVAESDDEMDAVLVADLRAYDTTGDETQGQLGDIVVMVAAPLSADLEGDASNDPITTITSNAGTAGDTVSVVPALVTASIVDTLGTDDKYATVEFTVDKGDNDFDSDDIVITTVEIETAVAPTGVTVRNSDSDTIATAQTTTTIAIANANSDAEITTGDTFEFKVEDDDSELRVVPNGISYTLDGATYSTNNDTVMNLGEYNESN